MVFELNSKRLALRTHLTIVLFRSVCMAKTQVLFPKGKGIAVMIKAKYSVLLKRDYLYSSTRSYRLFDSAIE